MFKFLALIAVASLVGSALGAIIVLPVAEAPAAVISKPYEPYNFICE